MPSHGRRPPDPRKVSPSHGRKPPNPQKVTPSPRARQKPPKTPSQAGSNTEACCPMVAAVRSVKRGKFRLAARYARMSGRLVLARI